MQNKWKVLLGVSIIVLSLSVALRRNYQNSYIGRSSHFLLTGFKRILFPESTQLREETQVLEQESIKVQVETQEPEQEPKEKLEGVQEQESPETQDVWEKASRKGALIIRSLPIQTGQEIENITIDFNIEPTDIIFADNLLTHVDDWRPYDYIDRNNYTVIYWNEKPKNEINGSIEIILHKTGNPNVSYHPWPIFRDLDNDRVRWHPYVHSPFDDPYFVALAKEITEGSDSQAEAVNRIVSYVNENINYTCFREIIEEYNDTVTEQYGEWRWSPLEVLKYGKAVCGGFAESANTLCKAVNITSRTVTGIIAPSGVNQSSEPTFMYHMWFQVWYERDGWVDYDPTIVERNLQRLVGLSVESSRYAVGGDIEGETTLHSATLLENNRVKITFIFEIFPEEPES